MPPLVISASLVLYKPDLKVVERTLRALQEAGQYASLDYGLTFKLTLVDNSDDPAVHRKIEDWMDDARHLLRGWTLQLLRAPGNIGYGRGNNLVISDAESDYHLVINPDLFVHQDALLEALRFMTLHESVGLLSPAVFGEDGERHYICKRHPTLLVMFLRSFSPGWLQSRLQFVMDKFEMRNCDYEKMIDPLEYPTGSFMFFRTKPLQAIGGFDPDFFLHYEDADIGRRMLAIAHVVYVPSVRVVHKWARDTHRSLKAKLITVRSGFLYWHKWGGVFSSRHAAELPYLERAIDEPLNLHAGVTSNVRVLVTGAGGFIGQAVCADLRLRGYEVTGALRQRDAVRESASANYVGVGDLDESTDWSSVVKGVDSVVHLAARVHLMNDPAEDPLSEFRRFNVDLTMNLARQAAKAGVRRFVFVSSIKVNGENSPFGQPFNADDIPRPTDPYGISKLEAELGLLELAASTGMEVVIIRPVLVYGSGVKANFQSMMDTLIKGLPLPLGALPNRRSFVALGNLVDLIAICLQHPAAGNQVFLVSDGEDLSISELLYRTATALGKSARLIPVPVMLLRAGARLIGQEAVMQRLCDSLQVDISKTRSVLGWSPPIGVDAALKETAQHVRGRNT